MRRLDYPILLILVIGLMAVVFALTNVKVVPEASYYRPYLTSSPAPEGTKAFYSLLAKQDIPVAIWKKPIHMLPANDNSSLMIMVEPYYIYGWEDFEYWVAWMERGNTLWLLICHHDADSGYESPFADDNNVLPVDHTDEEFSPYTSVEDGVKGFAALAGDYTLDLCPASRLPTEASDQVLLADEQGVVALARNYGDGELILCLGDSWIQNENILQDDHLEVLLALAERREFQRIWFNDYVHGEIAGTAALEAFPLWMLVFAAAACLWVLLELWRRGMRLGTAAIPRADRIRLADERIRALAAWYEQKGFYAESLAIQADFLRRHLFERWGVAAENDEQRLENILRSRVTVQEIGSWLEVYRLLSSDHPTGLPKAMSPHDFLAWSRRLSMMQKVIDKTFER